VKAARGAAAGAIDDALQALMARSGGKGTLPWH
jgi:hypothetical protein